MCTTVPPTGATVARDKKAEEQTKKITGKRRLSNKGSGTKKSCILAHTYFGLTVSFDTLLPSFHFFHFWQDRTHAMSPPAKFRAFSQTFTSARFLRFWRAVCGCKRSKPSELLLPSWQPFSTLAPHTTLHCTEFVGKRKFWVPFACSLLLYCHSCLRLFPLLFSSSFKGNMEGTSHSDSHMSLRCVACAFLFFLPF